MNLRDRTTIDRRSPSNPPLPACERKIPIFKLEVPTADRETSLSEPGTSTSKDETPSYQPGNSLSKPGMPTLRLETLVLKHETLTLGLQASGLAVNRSRSQLMP